MNKIKLAPFSGVSIVKLQQVNARWEESYYKHIPSTAENQ